MARGSISSNQHYSKEIIQWIYVCFQWQCIQSMGPRWMYGWRAMRLLRFVVNLDDLFHIKWFISMENWQKITMKPRTCSWISFAMLPMLLYWLRVSLYVCLSVIISSASFVCSTAHHFYVYTVEFICLRWIHAGMAEFSFHSAFYLYIWSYAVCTMPTYDQNRLCADCIMYVNYAMYTLFLNTHTHNSYLLVITKLRW